MSARWLIFLTLGWAWLDGYPQWRRCQTARVDAATMRAQVEGYEEELKYLPALRRRLESLPSPPQPRSPSAPGDLQVQIQAERVPSPLNSEEPLSGYRVKVAGRTAAVMAWLQSLCAHYSVEELEIQVQSNRARGQLVLLEIR